MPRESLGWFKKPEEAQIDLWVPPELVHDVENTSGLLSGAAERARVLGAKTACVYVPEALTGELEDENILRLDLEMGDPWYLKML